MKFIFEDDDIVIFIYKKLEIDITNKEDLENYIKEIIINLKKQYHKKISGFYNIKIYHNNNYGLIIKMEKEDTIDLFPELIDIKVEINYDSKIYLKIKDFFLIKEYTKEIYYYDNNFYIDINNLTNKEIIKLSEFYEITYGKEYEKIENKLIKIGQN